MAILLKTESPFACAHRFLSRNKARGDSRETAPPRPDLGTGYRIGDCSLRRWFLHTASLQQPVGSNFRSLTKILLLIMTDVWWAGLQGEMLVLRDEIAEIKMKTGTVS